MEIAQINPPMTNLQHEMLRLFARQLPETDLLAIRDLIAKYLLEKPFWRPTRLGTKKAIQSNRSKKCSMTSDEKLRVVLDTNVLLDALSPKLALRGILRALVAGQFELCVTTEIMLEYKASGF